MRLYKNLDVRLCSALPLLYFYCYVCGCCRCRHRHCCCYCCLLQFFLSAVRLDYSLLISVNTWICLPKTFFHYFSLLSFVILTMSLFHLCSLIFLSIPFTFPFACVGYLVCFTMKWMVSPSGYLLSRNALCFCTRASFFLLFFRWFPIRIFVFHLVGNSMIARILKYQRNFCREKVNNIALLDGYQT